MLYSRDITQSVNFLTVAILVFVVSVSVPVMAATPFVHEVVDTTGNVGRYASLALDNQGDPHISYCELFNGDLKYAVKTGSGWSIETADATGYVGWFVLTP